MNNTRVHKKYKNAPVVEGVVVASIVAVVEMKLLLVEDKTDSKVLQQN
jgi:hypothetical protein